MSVLKVAIIEPVGGHGGMNYYDFGLALSLLQFGVKASVYTCDETVVPDKLPFSLKRSLVESMDHHQLYFADTGLCVDYCRH